MQEMKNRAYEHVRWRNYTLKHKDPDIICFETKMKVHLWRFIQNGDPEVTKVGCLETITVEHQQNPHSFIDEAHRKALKVSELKKHDHLRHQYDKLLTRLPSIVQDKFGPQKLKTPEDKAKALVN